MDKNSLSWKAIQTAEVLRHVGSGGYVWSELLTATAKVLEPEGPTAAASLSTISAQDLQQRDIPPIRWIVCGLLPAGLTILAAPPKAGKSWAAMQLCLAVAAGGSFLGFSCNTCGALYAALEDSERRLKARLNRQLEGQPAPPGFDFTTEAPTLGNGLVDVLEGYIAQHPDVGLIVLDTLQKVRDMGNGRDVYGRDYADVGALKAFADSHNIAVLLIHHTRKLGDNDPFARISGTNGVTGAADTMLLLDRANRNADTATLSVTGRDVEMGEFSLRFDKAGCLWENMGDVEAVEAAKAQLEYQNSPLRRTILALLEQHPLGWTGTGQELLEAGRQFLGVDLAASGREISSRLQSMTSMLYDVDHITYDRPGGHGTAAAKHRFRPTK